MAPRPIADGELAGLFAEVASLRKVGLAVSGGPDSTALMHLYARWRSLVLAPPAMVLTVDHGLRPEARAEAAAVAEAARRLGLACEILAWQGPKPTTGIQDAAREARRRLLADAAAAHGLDAILTAHTEDDQAETLLMRLARGSGLDGLAGIPERSELEGAVFLRPLLGVAKARLLATLESGGISYVVDPSNLDPQFERSRWRRAAPLLDELGLTTANLALSARRLARARRALEALTDRLAREAVEVSALGVARLDLDRLTASPEEVALRLVRRLVAAVGGEQAPASLAKLEELAAWLLEAQGGGRTLARAEVKITCSARRRHAVFLRECGRMPPPVVAIGPGETRLWDGRFRIGLAPGAEAARIVPGMALPDELRSRISCDPREPGADAAPFLLRGTTLAATPIGATEAGISFGFVGRSMVFGAKDGCAETQK